MLIFRLPRVGKVAFDIGVGRLPRLIGGSRHGGLVSLFGAVPGLFPARIGEADGVVKNGALGHIGIRSGEARRQHSTHGVTDNRGALAMPSDCSSVRVFSAIS